MIINQNIWHNMILLCFGWLIVYLSPGRIAWHSFHYSWQFRDGIIGGDILAWRLMATGSIHLAL